MYDERGCQGWCLDGEGPVDALQVATRLTSREPFDGLRYRSVPLEAVLVDVVPCRRTAADVVYRLFRLRPVIPATLGAPCPDGLPEEWTSEAISIPRIPRSRVESKLSEFEGDFAVYTFLQRVEREIDDLLQRLSGAGRREARACATDGRGATSD